MKQFVDITSSHHLFFKLRLQKKDKKYITIYYNTIYINYLCNTSARLFNTYREGITLHTPKMCEQAQEQTINFFLCICVYCYLYIWMYMCIFTYVLL